MRRALLLAAAGTVTVVAAAAGGVLAALKQIDDAFDICLDADPPSPDLVALRLQERAFPIYGRTYPLFGVSPA